MENNQLKIGCNLQEIIRFFDDLRYLTFNYNQAVLSLGLFSIRNRIRCVGSKKNINNS